jgi:alanine dehydrogenase
LAEGVNVTEGTVTNAGVAQAHDMSYVELAKVWETAAN